MRYLRNNNEKSWWITNISKRNVTLADLRISVPAMKSINLLSKHYSFTLEQLEISAESGSIAKKSNIIRIRRVEPKVIPEPGLYIYDGKFPRKSRSNVKVEKEFFEELDETDDEFAESFSDIVNNEYIINPDDENEE